MIDEEFISGKGKIKTNIQNKYSNQSLFIIGIKKDNESKILGQIDSTDLTSYPLDTDLLINISHYIVKIIYNFYKDNYEFNYEPIIKHNKYMDEKENVCLHFYDEFMYKFNDEIRNIDELNKITNDIINIMDGYVI